jgi:EAL domain-containing protein (putative c-di-GMP-specific phosphodiesterase class I)/GGDEF domain-containing protein
MDANASSILIQELQDRLQRTIDSRAIVPVFQPIVDLQAGRISGFESLSRPGPDCDFSDATELFESAEKASMLWPIEQIARDQSLLAANDWPDGTQLFLNSSPEVFADQRFAREIIRGIESVPGLTPDRVVLEITEQASEQAIGGLERQVELLKDYGFQIAIDDVGAGRSGLNRIVTLRPQWLKLNRVLVDMVDQDRARQNMIRFFLHFARLSGVKLIAEGIERPEELWTLVDLGVQYGQGFYLGRPGARDQSLHPLLVEHLRSKSTPRHNSTTAASIVTILQYASTVPVVSSRQPIGQILSHIGDAPGCVVSDGTRVVGWCSTDKLRRLTWDHATEIGFACDADLCVAKPLASVGEVLSMAANRSDFSQAPVILADDQGIAGIVTPRALLTAASDVTTIHTRRVTPLTGLPNRVSCDTHIHSRIQHKRADAAACGAGDAAIIDVRGMSEFNGIYGFELGDQLIEQVAALISRIVIQGGEPEASDGLFLGHLGDDRFLVTSEGNWLPRRCMRLLHAFSRRGIGPINRPAANPHAVGNDLTLLMSPAEHLGLRCILLNGILNDVADVREFHSIVDGARRNTPQPGTRLEIGESELIVPRAAEPGAGWALRRVG